MNEGLKVEGLRLKVEGSRFLPLLPQLPQLSQTLTPHFPTPLDASLSA